MGNPRFCERTQLTKEEIQKKRALKVGFIFIFNIIVGTGALTLPAVFAKAGWLLSLIIVILLALISYITVTFVIEAIACANAVQKWRNLQFEREQDNADDDEALLSSSNRLDVEDGSTNAAVANSNMPSASSNFECMPLYEQRSQRCYYNLDNKFELGEMAALFFNDGGRILFYFCIVIYLYGDLSIYSAAIAKSLCDIACDVSNSSVPDNLSHFGFTAVDKTDICWKYHTMSRLNVYRLFLIGFTLVFGPLVAFSVQKTKYLQIVTGVFRFLAFTFMISIAIKMLCFDGAVQGHPVAVNIYGLPALFGACVYSFMCHHSLPSLLTPIRDKLSIRKLLSYDYACICTFYILLAMTGIFAFEHLKDLYTLNFIPTATSANDHSIQAQILLAIDYFLALFPIFTLSASFPIIAITLRNNLQTLFLDMTRFESYNFFVRRLLFPLCAVAPPFAITYFTESLTSLVQFTGSYAGAGIQYLIPISLVYFARRTCKELLGSGVINEFHSQFRSNNWLLFVLIWALVCMCLVTINLF